ncbi:MAG: ABC transporter ATP-binding protein [Hyphomonadaceae bacterium]|nr:ABC transporter ATP-binding protein [Hyphomonadaceae bacterium]
MSLILSRVSVSLGAHQAVQDISLRIESGQVVALLGPNGAGKTTLMRAALGLVAASGEIALAGADPAKLSSRERALRAAYLPQRPQAIWPVSVDSVVALGRFAHGGAPDRLSARDQAAVDAALEACALTAIRARRIDQLSGGEKARAHLARALAQQAAMLVLDEPTAGLDPAQALAVAAILRVHARQGAVLFSTHDVALAARIADHVLLMRDGRAIAEGAPRAALTPSALREAYGVEGSIEQVGETLTAVFRA